MLPYLISDKFKLVGVILAVAAVTLFFGMRTCNQIQSENENENTEIETINVPKPGSYDANCLRLTGKPCPPISK
jgi:predicted  nucleic acid-binding Zn-ribbon protein